MNEPLSPEQERIRAQELSLEWLGNFRELIDSGFIEAGERYGFDQLVEEAGIGRWEGMSEEAKSGAFTAVHLRFGIDLANEIPEEIVIKRYKEEGVRRARSEKGALVQVVPTLDPDVEVHIMDYEEPELGRRYDFVRAERWSLIDIFNSLPVNAKTLLISMVHPDEPTGMPLETLPELTQLSAEEIEQTIRILYEQNLLVRGQRTEKGFRIGYGSLIRLTNGTKNRIRAELLDLPPDMD